MKNLNRGLSPQAKLAANLFVRALRFELSMEDTAEHWIKSPDYLQKVLAEYGVLLGNPMLGTSLMAKNQYIYKAGICISCGSVHPGMYSRPILAACSSCHDLQCTVLNLDFIWTDSIYHCIIRLTSKNFKLYLSKVLEDLEAKVND